MQNNGKTPVSGPDAVKAAKSKKSTKCDNLPQASYPDGIIPGEKRIIDALVRDALKAGCTISVGHPMGWWDARMSRDYSEITACIAVSDETLLLVRDGDRTAAFFFVHGNEPYEVICDHTDNAFAYSLLANAAAIAEKMEDEAFGPVRANVGSVPPPQAIAAVSGLHRYDRLCRRSVFRGDLVMPARITTRHDDLTLLEMLHLHEHEGVSKSQIGKRYGKTKNSVIGMFHRVRLAHDAIECRCRKPANRDGGMEPRWWAKAGAA